MNTYLPQERPSTPGAGTPPAELGTGPHPCPASASPRPGSPTPGSRLRPRDLRGPDLAEGPRSQIRSLAPFPQSRGGASSQSSGARFSAPCPWPPEGHPERSEWASGRGSEHSLCPGSDLSLGNRKPATAPRPPHPPGRGWEEERRWEECQKGGHFRFLLRPDFVWLRGRKCSCADRHFS